MPAVEGMCGVIYCHINTVNGKLYVGQTHCGLVRRWRAHVTNALSTSTKRRCRAFHAAIRKYGPDAFEHVVLEDGLSVSEANTAEIRWIQLLNCRVPYGYNLAAGGLVNIDTHPTTRLRRRIAAKKWLSELTADERSAMARKAAASQTREQRCAKARKAVEGRDRTQHSEATRRGKAAVPPEQRREAALRARAVHPPEYWRDVSRAMWAKKTPEERSAIAHARLAVLSAEQRSEPIRQMWRGLTSEQREERRLNIKATLAALPDNVRRARALAGWETRRKRRVGKQSNAGS
jgi:group I intron endonuclease